MKRLSLLLVVILFFGCLSEENSADQHEAAEVGTIERDPDAQPPPGAGAEFTTDFALHTVPYDEILSGGPSKDGIPAIDNPAYSSITEAESSLSDPEPVKFRALWFSE